MYLIEDKNEEKFFIDELHILILAGNDVGKDRILVCYVGGSTTRFAPTCEFVLFQKHITSWLPITQMAYKNSSFLSELEIDRMVPNSRASRNGGRRLNS